ncbi:MAG: serine/threonine protein kinase [Candidatus Bathyarchaeia archaeon]
MENDPFIGQQLGAYTIQSKLGEGGMARVYKGYHARLRREVAIKVILSQIADKEGFKARFEREAQLIASLQHPNIVAVYDFGETGNVTYLVMQYVGGGTLRDQLRGGHALDPRQAILYCQEMAKALHHAHLRGIVHRDVKPQNMLVSTTDHNQLLLSDFGIAKLFDNRNEVTMIGATGGELRNDPSLTSVDQIIGTADYMSPEQINGKPVDARTDVYALGVVLYQMLAGEVPFHSTTIQGLLFQHVYTPPRFIREVNPNIPEVLGQITAKAMAKSPEDRFQSAEAMAQALESANQFVTNQLSASLPGNFLTSVQNTTLQMQNPPITPIPSYYTTQSPPVSNRVNVQQQEPSHYGMTPPYGSSPRITNPASAGLIKPAAKRSKSKTSITYIAFALVLLLAIGLLLAKQGVIPGLISNQNTPFTNATSFTETFQNTHLGWINGSSNGLTATVMSNNYALVVSKATPPNTYFPYPSNVGSLPDNFTWTVQISSNEADPKIFYGIAFRLKVDGTNVSCYAFVINGQGDYEVLKYIPGSTTPTPLWQAQSNSIHNGTNTSNKLQAIIKGNNFSFTINDTPVRDQRNPIKDNSGTPLYTGGQPALAVAGSSFSEMSFSATSAQLAIP